jgi:hypothetical protein
VPEPIADTVAAVGAPRRSDISPNTSPARRVPSGTPRAPTSSSPASTTNRPRALLALADDDRAGDDVVAGEAAQEVALLTRVNGRNSGLVAIRLASRRSRVKACSASATAGSSSARPASAALPTSSRSASVTASTEARRGCADNSAISPNTAFSPSRASSVARPRPSRATTRSSPLATR